ncbi:MAG TPA: response regulator [Candidatus Nanopelagicaceae bacterium]|nr:response regulator [Candidatus Nanopelagicaceae bacterium]
MKALKLIPEIKILLVEDEAHISALIRETLKIDPRVNICGEVDNAKDAIEVAKQTQPDVIVLDHYIEGDVMGMQAAPLIKVAAPNAKIILFTSHIFTFKDLRNAVIDSYLSKTAMQDLLKTAQNLAGVE